MNYPKISIFLLAAAMSAPTLVVADEDDETEMDVPGLEEHFIFFELNNTDGDLGIHAKIDGTEWKKLKIEDSKGRTMLDIKVKGRLKKQGLTELFFESAEPTFDELTTEEFFERFPEGTYTIEAKTLDGVKLEEDVEVSHVMPAPVGNVTISPLIMGMGSVALADDCDAAVLPVVVDDMDVVISWGAVTTSHPTIGTMGVDVTIASYQVVVEVDEKIEVMSTILPGNVFSLTIPKSYLALSGEWKFEILAQLENGNATAIETCFEVFGFEDDDEDDA